MTKVRFARREQLQLQLIEILTDYQTVAVSRCRDFGLVKIAESHPDMQRFSRKTGRKRKCKSSIASPGWIFKKDRCFFSADAIKKLELIR